jgi:hypothetical protein
MRRSGAELSNKMRNEKENEMKVAMEEKTDNTMQNQHQ